jgi:hypothetical protein
LPAMAADLVARRVNVIVALGSTPAIPRGLAAVSGDAVEAERRAVALHATR